MQPQSPNQQFDFILKNGQSGKKGFKLPLPNMPKPLLFGVGGVILILLFVTIFSLFSGGGNTNSQQFMGAIARAQEITRVSTLVEGLATDSNTQNLASTTNNVLGSGEQQLKTYLTGQGTVVTSVTLAADKNSSTDAQMQTAATNGNLASVYTSYLKAQLVKYQANLQAAYSIAGPRGKTIVKNAGVSAQVILSSPEVASAI